MWDECGSDFRLPQKYGELSRNKNKLFTAAT